MKAIRVLVFDDSAICRVRLRDILEADGDIRVVGEAANGDQALELVASTSPKLLVVDLQMPGTGGHDTIERVMANHPLPILVVTGQPEGVRRDAIFESVRRGALDLAEKPALADTRAQARLRALVRELSTVKVVRHVAGSLSRRRASRRPKTGATLPPKGGSGPPLVGIAASAGGPGALIALLAELPKNLAAAIAVVQHLPIGFTPAFAEFLQGRISLRVSIVDGPVTLEPARVYLATDDRHLVAATPTRLAPSDAPAVGGHRPAADVLFDSVAAQFGQRALGIILSGMGRDGVSGLGAMRSRGATTLAQDLASSVVFGMPRAAIESGAAEQALDPVAMAYWVRSWAGTRGAGAKP